jgi:hypothetical protein
MGFRPRFREFTILLLLKKHFLNDFAAALDHPLSLASIRATAASGSPIVTSPITRRKLVGAIPLGAVKSHVQAADWTLSRILSGGKALGNADLWFAVLWMMIEDGALRISLNYCHSFANR